MKRKKRRDKLRVVIKALSAKEAQSAAEMILNAMSDLSAGTSGPVPLPTKLGDLRYRGRELLACDERNYTNIQVHVRLIDFIKPCKGFVQELSLLNVPSSVNIEFKQP
jgi:ribosomal protein S10